MAKNELLGPWGERCAAEYLRLGCGREEYLACNYRCRFGEIDIIARNREYLTFVEVKLRKSDAFGEAREFVDARKQERIRATAALWLETHETALQPRFDVVEVYAPDGMHTKAPEIRLIEDAF